MADLNRNLTIDQLFAEAQEKWDDNFGDKHPELEEVFNNYFFAAYEQGFDEAREYFST